MAIERTLADPLSTQEIKEIALQEFKKRMDANSLLADGLTYSGVHLKFEAQFSLAGRGTLVWSDATTGDYKIGLDMGAESKTEPVTFEYRSESPNEARESHNLPIPVLVKTPSGNERRKVKFAPKEAR